MYDVIIIGGGIAGLTAAIYCRRYKLKTLILTKDKGGIIMDAHLVENWPGEPAISGPELMKRAENHARKFGVEIIEETVLDVKEGFVVKTKKNEYKAKSIICTVGTQRRKLGIPGESEFTKKGIHYCATCDAPRYEGEEVALIGGGNSACRAAQLLCEYASKIHMIYMEEKMIAEPMLAEWALSNSKIQQYPGTSLKEIKGKVLVDSIVTTTNKEIKIAGVFIEIGYVPNIDAFKNLNLETERGFIKVDIEHNTNVKGFFAAGDICNASNFKQLVTAAGQGSVAAFSVYKFLIN